MEHVFSALLHELELGRFCELVTIVSVEGTAPREPGCTMLIGEGGIQLAGTVGGGCIEWQSLKRGAILLREHKNDTLVFEHGCRTETDGPSCGAKITLRFTACSPDNVQLQNALKSGLASEGGTLLIIDNDKAEFIPNRKPVSTRKENELSLYLPPKDRVFVFGAGHVAQALVPVLKPLNFHVTVYDDRKDLADRKHFPEADYVISGSFFCDLAAATGVKKNDYIVIMSASHGSDENILSHFADADYRYIGMLGSRKKREAIRTNLIKKGVPETRLNNIHIPIGISIGAKTPEEVALSVAAELVQVRALTTGLNNE